MAQKYDLVIEQGSSFSLEIIPRDSAGNFLDLTGCTARAQIRQNYADISPEAAAVFLPAVDVSGGRYTLSLTPLQTAALAITRGKWDTELVDTNGDVVRVLEGSVIVRKEVTR